MGLDAPLKPASGWCTRRPVACCWDGGPSRTDIGINPSQVSSKTPAFRLCSEPVDIVPWCSKIMIRSWSVSVWLHDYVDYATDQKEKL
jgi:hypothetical protein